MIWNVALWRGLGAAYPRRGRRMGSTRTIRWDESATCNPWLVPGSTGRDDTGSPPDEVERQQAVDYLTSITRASGSGDGGRKSDRYALAGQGCCLVGWAPAQFLGTCAAGPAGPGAEIQRQPSISWLLTGGRAARYSRKQGRRAMVMARRWTGTNKPGNPKQSEVCPLIPPCRLRHSVGKTLIRRTTMRFRG